MSGERAGPSVARVVLSEEGELSVAGAATRPAAFGVIAAADVLSARAPGPVGRFYRHGWHSFSSARWVSLERPPEVVVSAELRLGADDPAFALSERHGGSGLAAVEIGAGEVLLVGALGVGGRVEWDGDGLAAATADPPGIWYVGHGPEADVFAAYAACLRDALGARPAAAPPTWMSWYSFGAEIDEARLGAVLDELTGMPFECVLVDDGWERAVGDWQPGPGFPGGMERFAARIRAAGFTPGLWLAPLLAPRGGPVWREHRDWLVCDAAGTPVRAGVNWGADYFGLDLTHPDALAHVVDLARTAVAWGYRVLKLDFLFAGAIPGRRRDPSVGRETAYRLGMAAVREAVGDDVRLLACGAPILASLGVFDAIRVGPDVAPWWENGLARHLRVRSEPATRGAIATAVDRLWLAPLIGLDPDVVYVRSRQQMLTREQQELLLDLARVCDCRATSDPPGWLDPDEAARLQAFLCERPVVERLGRHRWAIDGRTVDFGAVLED